MKFVVFILIALVGIVSAQDRCCCNINSVITCGVTPVLCETALGVCLTTSPVTTTQSTGTPAPNSCRCCQSATSNVCIDGVDRGQCSSSGNVCVEDPRCCCGLTQQSCTSGVPLGLCAKDPSTTCFFSGAGPTASPPPTQPPTNPPTIDPNGTCCCTTLGSPQCGVPVATCMKFGGVCNAPLCCCRYDPNRPCIQTEVETCRLPHPLTGLPFGVCVTSAPTTAAPTTAAPTPLPKECCCKTPKTPTCAAGVPENACVEKLGGTCEPDLCCCKFSDNEPCINVYQDICESRHPFLPQPIGVCQP